MVRDRARIISAGAIDHPPVLCASGSAQATTRPARRPPPGRGGSAARPLRHSLRLRAWAYLLVTTTAAKPSPSRTRRPVGTVFSTTVTHMPSVVTGAPGSLCLYQRCCLRSSRQECHARVGDCAGAVRPAYSSGEPLGVTLTSTTGTALPTINRR